MPDYRRLDAYQETMTREEFVRALDTLYAPHGGWKPFVRLDAQAAVLRKTGVALDDLYTLRFAADDAHKKPGRPPSGVRVRRCHPPRRPATDRSPACASRWIPVISGGVGRAWRNAGSASAIPPR